MNNTPGNNFREISDFLLLPPKTPKVILPNPMAVEMGGDVFKSDCFLLTKASRLKKFFLVFYGNEIRFYRSASDQ